MTRMKTIGLFILLGCALMGCTPTMTTPPSGSPSESTHTTPVVSTTPTPTPSPAWGPDEQAAVDVVQQYLTVWATIGQNLTTADWDQIWTVAVDDQGNHAIQTWLKWFKSDWHLTGAPTFTPTSVTQPMEDDRGKRYTVRGCYAIEDSYVVDADGTPIVDETREDRGMTTYTVLRTLQDKYLVSSSIAEEETC